MLNVSRSGDEGAVKTLSCRRRWVGVGERPKVGGRCVRGDQGPIGQGQIRAGLQIVEFASKSTFPRISVFGLRILLRLDSVCPTPHEKIEL